MRQECSVVEFSTWDINIDLNVVGRRDMFSHVVEDGIMSPGIALLIQGWLAVVEDVVEGAGSTTAEFAFGINSFLPAKQIVGCGQRISSCTSSERHDTFWNTVFE